MYAIYVLKSLKDGNFYYGQTANLEKRLEDHNLGRVKSTKSRKPFNLVYYETVNTIGEARKREKYFKSGYGRKFIKNRLK